MKVTIKGKTAGGILKTAKISQMPAGTWEIVVSHPNVCVAMICERADGWGGRVADVLVLTDASGVVARLEMSATALAKMQDLAAQCEAKYSAEIED